MHLNPSFFSSLLLPLPLPLPPLCLSFASACMALGQKGESLCEALGQKGESLCERETTASTKNTYNNYTKLPLISKHVPKHKNQLTLTELGYFLSGLNDGTGWFAK